MLPNPFLVTINTQLYRWKTVAKVFGLLFFFFNKLPKENNRPIGENSPDLVTLD
jgi:hypothetical protein